MKIKDLPLLKRFAGAGRCELCGTPCRKREAHHAFSRGAGRLDIPINLVAIGSTRKRECLCHARIHGQHSPRITTDEVLAVIARRETVTVEFIVNEVYRLRRPGATSR